MMTIDEMKAAKERLHYTNEMISEKSGVPLPTVQKILSGTTKRPRYSTLEALDSIFRPAKGEPRYEYEPGYGLMEVGEAEAAPAYYDACVTPLHPRYKIPVRKQGQYTTGDIEQIPDDIRVELIDGVIYDMASPTYRHQTIIVKVCTIISNTINRIGAGCMAFVAPLDIDLGNDNRTRVQPDLLVICRHENDSDGLTDGDTGRESSTDLKENNAGKSQQLVPDFIMEVLSPSTKQVDMLIKLNKYYQSGVREYWIVDPEDETITVYDFENVKLSIRYTFNDTVPVAISDGKCSVDFREVRQELGRADNIMMSLAK